MIITAFKINAGINSPLCWNKYPPEHEQKLVTELNEHEHSLLVCKTLFDTLVISRLVKDRVLVENEAPEKISIPASVDYVFVMDDDSKLLDAGTLLNAVSKKGDWQIDPFANKIWKLTRRAPGYIIDGTATKTLNR